MKINISKYNKKMLNINFNNIWNNKSYYMIMKKFQNIYEQRNYVPRKNEEIIFKNIYLIFNISIDIKRKIYNLKSFTKVIKCQCLEVP